MRPSLLATVVAVADAQIVFKTLPDGLSIIDQRPRTALQIVHGQASRHKQVLVHAMGADAVLARLGGKQVANAR